MKTPDEIKKGLECCFSDMDCEVPIPCPYAFEKGSCDNLMMSDALAYIQQLEAKVPGWISVEERLPEDGQPVIVFATHTDKWSGHWHAVMEDCWCCGGWDANCDTDIHKVTHWMPMPEPPVEV